MRYRVQLIPISGGGWNLQDGNDSREAVGSVKTLDGNKGFYYNAASRVYLTATDMRPELTGSGDATLMALRARWMHLPILRAFLS